MPNYGGMTPEQTQEYIRQYGTSPRRAAAKKHGSKDLLRTIGQFGLTAATAGAFGPGAQQFAPFAAGLFGGGGGGDMQEPPELAEIRRRLAEGGGYSPREIEQMRAALTQALTIQRDRATAQLRGQMRSQGMSGSQQEQLGLQRINSSYADALSQGVSQIMAESVGQARQTSGQLLQLGLYGGLQYGQQQQEQKQSYLESLGGLAEAYGATRGRGQQPAAPMSSGGSPSGPSQAPYGFMPSSPNIPFSQYQPGSGRAPVSTPGLSSTVPWGQQATGQQLSMPGISAGPMWQTWTQERGPWQEPGGKRPYTWRFGPKGWNYGSYRPAFGNPNPQGRGYL